MKRIGINGLGRIGKMVLRTILDRDQVELVAINDLIPIDSIVHLLKYDSVHGQYKRSITIQNDNLIIKNKSIAVYHEKTPATIPWIELGVEYVIEASGEFKSADTLKLHLEAGAKKVILCQPAIGGIDRTVVIGVNENTIKKTDTIISNASCTSNCVAPLLKVLDDEFGVSKAFFNTVHPSTNNQSLLDGHHNDLRRSRAAMCNIIPTTSSAVGIIDLVLPQLSGRVNGFATRVPITIGSYVEIVATLQNNTTIEKIHQAFKKASRKTYKGIIEYSDEALVSSDIIGNSSSAIYDALSTKLIDGNFVQILAWYDNETAYAHRIVDLLEIL
jgi:glyceraldehyde 3-phosphate dehydrogenase